MPSATITLQSVTGKTAKYLIMLFAYFILAVALLIETVGAYYSITGLAAIFSGAVVPILIMGGSLELGKVTAAVWLKNNWDRAGTTYKLYLLPAVAMLMLITSMGIFGYLSKAHNDQTLVSGDVGAQLAIYDEKIRTAKDNIESARKQLAQMDAAVDQVLARSTTEGGADKANAIRNSQKRDRAALAKEIETNQRTVAQINDEAAPIRAENRKVEAEVGPIKYIAALIYGTNPDANILEKAVTWVIIMIVAVFDPLALVLILAAQQSIRWARGEDVVEAEEETESVESWFDRARRRARFWDQEPKHEDPEGFATTVEELEPVVDQQTHISPEDYYRAMHLFDAKVALTDPYINDSYTKTPEPDTSIEDSITFDKPAVEEPKLNSKISLGVVEDPTRPGWMFVESPHPSAEITDKLIVDQTSGVAVLNNEYVEVDGKKMHHKAFDSGSDDAGHAIERHKEKLKDPAIPELSLKADNVLDNTPGRVVGFGSQFPADVAKGDMFLRVDRLPSVMYKFNGINWIEVDKALSDQHAYDDAYIDHLIEKIDTGEYDPELLSDAERERIENKLKNIL